MTTELTLATLKTMWLAAKADEQAANARRLDVERAMLRFFPAGHTEGTLTDKSAGVSVTFKNNRKVDTEALRAAWATLPPNAQSVFRWSADVDTKQYRAIDEAALYQVQKFITTTAAKPSITVSKDQA